jgi:hypothetical protein
VNNQKHCQSSRCLFSAWLAGDRNFNIRLGIFSQQRHVYDLEQPLVAEMLVAMTTGRLSSYYELLDRCKMWAIFFGQKRARASSCVRLRVNLRSSAETDDFAPTAQTIVLISKYVNASFKPC